MNTYHYGLAVGIGRYPGVSDLHAPVLDAKDFHDWMVGEGMVPPENAALITSPGLNVPLADADSGVPVKDHIDQGLGKLHAKARADIDKAKNRWQESRLYLYVAGHGIMPNSGETALLLANAQPGMYFNLELAAYLDWYRNSGIFKEVVVFADCCRNWFAQVRASVVPFDDPPEPGARVFWLAGYAAGPGDPAYEVIEDSVPPDDRRGYFTTAVLAGLRGAAPVDEGLGCITSTTLAQYVTVAVASATKHKRVPQEVQMPSEPARPIRFGRPTSQAGLTRVTTHPVTIRFPPGFTAPVELHMPDGSRRMYVGAPTPWAVDLPTGLYGVYHAGSWDAAGLNAPTFTLTGASNVQL